MLAGCVQGRGGGVKKAQNTYTLTYYINGPERMLTQVLSQKETTEWLREKEEKIVSKGYFRFSYPQSIDMSKPPLQYS